MSPPATPARTHRANARAQRSSPSRSASAQPARASAANNAPADQGAQTLVFLKALGAGSSAEALAAWNALGDDVKTNIRNMSLFLSVLSGFPGDDVVEMMLDVMGKDALAPMHEAGVDIGSERAYVEHVLDTHDGAYWLQPLKAAQQWRSFVNSEPKGTNVTSDQASKLNSFVQAATVAADARDLFEKVYPSLDDRSYAPRMLLTAPWRLGPIQGLYEALSTYLPVQHVHTIIQGFHLGEMANLGGGGRRQLRFGWWHNDHVVLPAASTRVGGGGWDHDMTGGLNSGVAVAGTPDDPVLTHWEGTVLHEIGHGVGAKTDGNQFAERHGGWRPEPGVDAWSQNLFDDAAVFGNAAAAVGNAAAAVANVAAAVAAAANPVLTARDARLYMANKIAGARYDVPNLSDNEVRDLLDQLYDNQPLYAYYKSRVIQGKEDYVVDENNVSGGRVYIWCSRFNNQFVSYREAIYDSRVSAYGLSSPKEWFAEVYTYYYRTGKAAPILAQHDRVTKQKLDDIDAMKWDPAAVSASGGPGALVTPVVPVAPGAGGGGRPDAVGAQTPLATRAGQTAQVGGAPLRRLPFPW